MVCCRSCGPGRGRRQAWSGRSRPAIPHFAPAACAVVTCATGRGASWNLASCPARRCSPLQLCSRSSTPLRKVPAGSVWQSPPATLRFAPGSSLGNPYRKGRARGGAAGSRGFRPPRGARTADSSAAPGRKCRGTGGIRRIGQPSRAKVSSCLLWKPWNSTAPGMAANCATVSWSVSPWNLMVQTRFRAFSAAIQRCTSPSSRAG